uniref:Putative mrna export factor tap/mex67 n=1 Tax=Lutzomyia longipalpis TaxID=7200 RepID=A0A1B0CGX4_LUTLO
MIVQIFVVLGQKIYSPDNLKAFKLDPNDVLFNYWHKVTIDVKRSDQKKLDVVDCLAEYVTGAFVPVYFRQFGHEYIFYVRDCVKALNDLMRNELRLENASTGRGDIMIYLNVAKIELSHPDPDRTVAEVLKSRRQELTQKVTYNLSAFDQDKRFQNMVFKLGFPGNFEKICRLIKDSGIPPANTIEMRLYRNNLQDLTPLQLLKDFYFEHLDITNNTLDLQQTSLVFWMSAPIVEDPSFQKIYSPDNLKAFKLDPNDVLFNYWHKVIIDVKRSDQKKLDVVDCLAEYVTGAFVPVYFRQFGHEYIFYVRDCVKALNDLMRNELRLENASTGRGDIMIYLNVAKIELSHPDPDRTVAEVLKSRRQELTQKVTYNLSAFDQDKRFQNMVFKLGFPGNFEKICRLIKDSGIPPANTIEMRLYRNNLQDLTPLQLLKDFYFEHLDITNNTNLCCNYKLRIVKELLSNVERCNNTVIFIPTKGHGIPESHKAQATVPQSYAATPLIERRPDTIIQPSYAEPVAPSGQLCIQLADPTFHFPTSGVHCTAGVKLNFMQFNNNLWHFVMIIHNGCYSRRDILNGLYAIQVKSNCFPYHYINGDRADTFYLLDSFNLMHEIYNNGMELALPDANVSLKVEFRLNVIATKRLDAIKCETAIEKALQERIDDAKMVLDLSNFAEAMEKHDFIFEMRNPQAITTLFACRMGRFAPRVNTILLNDNEISVIRDVLLLLSAQTLDLSNNKIENLENIFIINSANITNLRLMGNPLCKKYSSSLQYISAVRGVFSGLKTLDGVDVANDDVTNGYRNWICSPDCFSFVSQFIDKYFRAYDSLHRGNLKDLYSRRSILTVGTDFTKIKMMTMQKQKWQHYTTLSRNMLNVANYRQKNHLVYVGWSGIYDALCKLPPTEHDRQSFCVEVPIYSDEMAVITIYGMFREQIQSLLDKELILGFSRTFILRPIEADCGLFGNGIRYFIVNEKISVFNPTIIQHQNAFKVPAEVPERPKEITEEEKKEFTLMFSDCTNLKPGWSRRCLTKVNWDFKLALEVFVSLFEENKIPAKGFIATLPKDTPAVLPDQSRYM